MIERDFWLMLRDGLLVQVDAIERKLELQPRTAELRQRARQDRIEITKHTEREATREVQ